MSERLAGKVAVIFGGAGRIGSALARVYVAEGARVILLDRNESKLNALRAELELLRSDSCSILVANIEGEADVEKLSDSLSKGVGPVDILVNCPAYIFRAPFLEHPLEELDKQWHTNVRLVFIVSKVVARLMLRQRHGKIINLASIGGQYPEKEHAGHCAAKAALIALSRVMALELAPHNIQVNVVAPGPTETVPFSSPFYASHPEVLARLEESTPAGRIGHPEDHTGLMVFLASEESNWITGQVILSDGGLGLV